MLSERVEEATVEFQPAPTWAPEPSPSAKPDWRVVDRKLRAIRRSRAALDAEEMHWLREAEALQIWRPLGMVSAMDYLERVLNLRSAHRPGADARCACARCLAGAHRRARR